MNFNNPNNEDPAIDDEGVDMDGAVDEDEATHDSGNEDGDVDVAGISSFLNSHLNFSVQDSI